MNRTREYAGSSKQQERPHIRASQAWLRNLFIVLSILFLVWLLFFSLARFLIVETSSTSADALVVLSGSANYIERTRRAAEIFREGRVPMVIITNDNLRGPWASAEQRNPFFFELEVKELVAAGVPVERIKVISEPVTSTYDEATAIRKFAADMNLHSLVVVTSAFHSRRALWTFRRVLADSDISVDINPVRRNVEAPGPSNWWLFRRGWREVPLEYVKLIYYWIRYHS